ncbi:MAG: hypothetical protein M3Z16_02080 [Pseudomonadota bacterium]|nr:hypothetical protein [Pseudomonadota bacterium]
MDDDVRVRAWTAAGKREVCICGIGARTPLGMDAASSAAAVRGAISAVTMHPLFLDRFGEPACLASDAVLSPQLAVAARLQTMLASALDEALRGFDSPAPIPCWLALPQPRAGINEDIHHQLVRALTRHPGTPVVSSVRILPEGHAAGLMAMQAAAQQIAAGEIDVCLAAAVDSYHDGATLRWLDEAGRLMSSSNRNGFPPGEAAGVCLLASATAATRNRWPILGRIVSAATAVEPAPLGSEAVSTGRGLTAAVAGAASGLQPGQLVTATYCDLNGERHRNEEFSYTLLRTQHAFVDAHDYLHPADCWGDVGAASGVLFAALSIVAAQRGYGRGESPLLWAGSDSGHRTALLLSLRDPTDARAPAP